MADSNDAEVPNVGVTFVTKDGKSPLGDPDEHPAAVSLRTAHATECPRNPVQWTIFTENGHTSPHTHGPPQLRAFTGSTPFAVNRAIANRHSDGGNNVSARFEVAGSGQQMGKAFGVPGVR